MEVFLPPLGKKQKAQFIKPQLPCLNSQIQAAGGAATKRGLSMRQEKQWEAEIHKRNEQRNDLLQGTSGSQSSGNNWRHDHSFKAAELVSDEEVQAYSSAPQVTTQLLSGERERERENQINPDRNSGTLKISWASQLLI